MYLDKEIRLIFQKVLEKDNSCQIPIIYPSFIDVKTFPFISQQLSFSWSLWLGTTPNAFRNWATFLCPQTWWTAIWLRGKTHLQKTRLATCSNFSVVIQMQSIHSGFLFWPYFLWLFLLCLCCSSYKLCGQLFPPGVLAKEFISSHAFFKLFFQFLLGMSYYSICQVLSFSIFFAWTRPQFSEDLLYF